MHTHLYKRKIQIHLYTGTYIHKHIQTLLHTNSHIHTFKHTQSYAYIHAHSQANKHLCTIKNTFHTHTHKYTLITPMYT